MYIFEINSSSVASFAIIFSHSEGYLFVLFMISFAVQKLLSLTRSHLFIFAFFPIILGGGSTSNKCWRGCGTYPLIKGQIFEVNSLAL